MTWPGSGRTTRRSWPLREEIPGPGKLFVGIILCRARGVVRYFAYHYPVQLTAQGTARWVAFPRFNEAPFPDRVTDQMTGAEIPQRVVLWPSNSPMVRRCPNCAGHLFLLMPGMFLFVEQRVEQPYPMWFSETPVETITLALICPTEVRPNALCLNQQQQSVVTPPAAMWYQRLCTNENQTNVNNTCARLKQQLLLGNIKTASIQSNVTKIKNATKTNRTATSSSTAIFSSSSSTAITTAVTGPSSSSSTALLRPSSSSSSTAPWGLWSSSTGEVMVDSSTTVSGNNNNKTTNRTVVLPSHDEQSQSDSSVLLYSLISLGVVGGVLSVAGAGYYSIRRYIRQQRQSNSKHHFLTSQVIQSDQGHMVKHSL